MDTVVKDSMKSWFDFGVFGYIPQDKTQIQYLTQVYESNQSNTDELPEVGLRLNKTEIQLTTEEIDIADGDEMYAVSEHVIDKAFYRLMEVADANRILANSKFPTGIDMTADNGSNPRKVLSRILAVANMIASMGRRGPANFVLVSESMYKQLFFGDPGGKKFYRPDSSMAGLNFFISPVGNKIIVGRKGGEMEPGIFLKCMEPKAEDYILNENHDLSKVKANYAIVEVGDYLPYISFNILD